MGQRLNYFLISGESWDTVGRVGYSPVSYHSIICCISQCLVHSVEAVIKETFKFNRNRSAKIQMVIII